MAGRVTARRLNRVEYNNTIRDLLGVAARPADEFPVDDSGYGFDNNGDVLSVSPMLMEKYMQAAEKISRLAVYGEPLPPKPTRLVRLMNRRSQDAYDVRLGRKLGRVSAVFAARRDVRQLHVPGRWRVRVPAAHREFPRRRRRISPTKREPAAPKSAESCSKQRRLEREKAAAAAGTAAPAPGGGGAVDRGASPRPKS